jgi:serine/threonine-protein phosphatase 5
VPISFRIREQLDSGVEVDRSYNGPRLEYVEGEGGKKEARITKQFVDEMVEYFKEGKTIHRRYAWEIVLGAQKELLKHESLVDVEVPAGQTADVLALLPRFFGWEND